MNSIILAYCCYEFLKSNIEGFEYKSALYRKLTMSILFRLLERSKLRLEGQNTF